jgi:hypothetical protein
MSSSACGHISITRGIRQWLQWRVGSSSMTRARQLHIMSAMLLHGAAHGGVVSAHLLALAPLRLLPLLGLPLLGLPLLLMLILLLPFLLHVLLLLLPYLLLLLYLLLLRLLLLRVAAMCFRPRRLRRTRRLLSACRCRPTAPWNQCRPVDRDGMIAGKCCSCTQSLRQVARRSLCAPGGASRL